VAGEFDEWECLKHIYVREGLALLKSMRILANEHYDLLAGAMVICMVDSMVLFNVYENGGSTTNLELTE